MCGAMCSSILSSNVIMRSYKVGKNPIDGLLGRSQGRAGVSETVHERRRLGHRCFREPQALGRRRVAVRPRGGVPMGAAQMQALPPRHAEVVLRPAPNVGSRSLINGPGQPAPPGPRSNEGGGRGMEVNSVLDESCRLVICQVGSPRFEEARTAGLSRKNPRPGYRAPGIVKRVIADRRPHGPEQRWTRGLWTPGTGAVSTRFGGPRNDS